MEKTEYDAYINAARQQQVDTATAKQDFFFQGLVTNKPMNYIKESEFKTWLLPGLTPGFVTNEQVYATFLRNWIAIAGAAASELGVVDDITGQPLFVCPSLYDTTVINPDREIGDNRTIARFFTAYQQQLKHLETAANSFFNNNGQVALNKAFVAKPNMDAATNKWMFIYNRYDIQVPQSGPQSTINAPALGNDEIIYD